MKSFATQLSIHVQKVFEAHGLPTELGVVRVSDRPDLAQFQCNGAFEAAKIAKKNPRAIAQDIVTELQDNPIFQTLEIAGPGFININVTNEALNAYIADFSTTDDFGIDKVQTDQYAILDYGGMNVAKAMHVGHLRSLAIGDCLKRLMRAAGYTALGDIHLGDWGLQMGQIISEFEIRYPDWPYFDENYTGEYPAQAPFDYAELEEIYPAASNACKENTDRLESARLATAELQTGRKGYIALWQHFITLSIADIKDNIAPLGIDFNLWKGESDVNALIPEITKDLAAKNITEGSQGAKIIHVAKDDDNEDIPPLIFLKSDGAATYGTTDLATIYDRIKTYPNLTHIIYETDLRQKLHFEQVFRAAEKAGYTKDITLKHIGHGTINGKDGKPFKTREGKAMTFRDMVAACHAKALERLKEANISADISQKEHADIAAKVTCAALKFAELSNQAHVDYIFDLDRMTSFEGKTGPYLLYQAVRIQSILAKATADNGAETNKTAANDTIITEDANKKLLLTLAEFQDHFTNALTHYTPNTLCDYTYRLAQDFSAFYAACPILSEEDETLKSSRLALCTLIHRHLVFVLDLLGISVPDRM